MGDEGSVGCLIDLLEARGEGGKTMIRYGCGREYLGVEACQMYKGKILRRSFHGGVDDVTRQIRELGGKLVRRSALAALQMAPRKQMRQSEMSYEDDRHTGYPC